MKTENLERRNDYEDSDSDEQLRESDSPVDSELSDQRDLSNDENPDIQEEDAEGFDSLAKQKKKG